MSCIFIPPGTSTTLQAEDSQVARLYFYANSELRTQEPIESQSETFSFGPSLMVRAQTVDRWTTGPLAKAMTISGDFDIVFWASGSGAVYFEIRIYVNNENAGISLASGTKMLSQTPQEYTSTETGANLELAAGDVFEIDVAVYLLGGEVTVHWGSTEHQSNVILPCDSISIETPGYSVDTGSQQIMLNTTIVSAFGADDIANYTIQIAGPIVPEHITELEPQNVDGALTVAWIWEYGKDQTKTGEEYAVTIHVQDNTGNEWSKSSNETITLEVRESEEQTNMGLIVVAIVVVIILCLFAVFRYFKVTRAKE
jgi:hypothetical protein